MSSCAFTTTSQNRGHPLIQQWQGLRGGRAEGARNGNVTSACSTSYHVAAACDASLPGSDGAAGSVQRSGMPTALLAAPTARCMGADAAPLRRLPLARIGSAPPIASLTQQAATSSSSARVTAADVFKLGDALCQVRACQRRRVLRMQAGVRTHAPWHAPWHDQLRLLTETTTRTHQRVATFWRRSCMPGASPRCGGRRTRAPAPARAGRMWCSRWVGHPAPAPLLLVGHMRL
jgi:hypothetical protein